MTTKDQAIVPNLREAVSIVLEGWTLPDAARKQLEAAYWAAQPPAPDCRTCENLESCKEDAKWLRNYCTNGDQYQPAPKVVLWRTV